MNDERAIRVLSVRQPHADSIIYGPKWAENRTWRTKYRGELYIHASRWDGPKCETLGHGTVGAIIGKVRLVDVVDLNSVVRRDRGKLLREIAKQHDLPDGRINLKFACGPICFILAEPEPLRVPVPVLGRLRLWTFRLPPNEPRADPGHRAK